MLKDLIENKNARVGIIGFGYVGLPLAIEIAKSGYHVLGVDLDTQRIRKINNGISYINDVKSKELKTFVKGKKISATTDYSKLKECNIIIISVPTPINVNKEPDLTAVTQATKEIAKILKRGQLIILKSTTYPETTEKVVLPILNRRGFTVGEDFYLAFCPERIDPGNEKFGVANTPAVVGGITERCTEIATLFYRQFVKVVYPVSSAKAAELTKLLENTFRNVNIALVNEFAQLCERMGGIDIWEVIEAAKTKPFGFMPFYPGPGIGGHCIPIDPYYLSYKAREYDFHTAFIELSARINEEMPYFVVNKAVNTLSASGICPSEAQILILGMAFKKDIGDLRDSPAIKVYKIIRDRVKTVLYNDPYASEVVIDKKVIKSVELNKRVLTESDLVIIVTDHSVYDYPWIVENARLIFDTRNAIKRKNKKVIRLGAG